MRLPATCSNNRKLSASRVRSTLVLCVCSLARCSCSCALKVTTSSGAAEAAASSPGIGNSLDALALLAMLRVNTVLTSTLASSLLGVWENSCSYVRSRRLLIKGQGGRRYPTPARQQTASGQRRYPPKRSPLASAGRAALWCSFWLAISLPVERRSDGPARPWIVLLFASRKFRSRSAPLDHDELCRRNGRRDSQGALSLWLCLDDLGLPEHPDEAREVQGQSVMP